MEFIRYQSVVPNRHGNWPGVFALANGLAADGALSAQDFGWLRATNALANELYADPTTVEPECYDRDKNPGARSWFKSSAKELITMTRQYLKLLDRHEIGWVELRTTAPGRVTYEDAVQVVAVPHTHAAHWPFARTRPITHEAAAGDRTQTPPGREEWIGDN
ncbi:hypothetical protein JOF34_001850 [Microbacterium amylolyticum]|uniref:Uncharacterized protein n=2 Tax=Microbacterium amylolyticum TaxID=936337 RepID=A0ABS4ZIZ7_9MICO|nr:hypothetical protein [Microbacterium amylolyticum]